MRFGAHVRAGPTLLGAIERAHELAADVVQIFTQSSRAWRASRRPPEVLAAYREAVAAEPGGLPTFCHAPYLINQGSNDPERLGLSRACLAENLVAARAIGAAGLVLHAGSHLGAGFDARLDQVARELTEALETDGDPDSVCPILVEDADGAGGTIGRSLSEQARILEAAGDRPDLGVCLDTQHLWAAGIAYGSIAEADALVSAFERTIGLERLGCLHVNDSKVAFGAARDRHANIGEGEIGPVALGSLLGDPALQGMPAILEVPGAGHGPRAEDLAALRDAHRLGSERRGSRPCAPVRGRQS